MLVVLWMFLLASCGSPCGEGTVEKNGQCVPAGGDDSAAPDSESDSDTDSDTDADSDTDTDSDADPPCAATGFSASAGSWALPPGFPEMTFEKASDVATSALNWSLLDLGGDGRTDLVVSRWDTAGIADLGTTKWLIYENNGSGFSSNASGWTLPPGFPELTFDEVTDTSDSGLNWSLLDIDGNGAVDLVLTRWDSAAIAGLGTEQWLVYENTGSGFASSPSSWTLPAGFPSLTFDEVLDSSDSSLNWSLVDLDADGRVDLVLTRWDSAAIADLGTSKWLVYPNTGTGFAASASAWALPPGFPSLTFDEVVDSSDSALNWSLVDLDADRALDFVLTRWDTAGIAGLGDSQWLLYPNSGTGFASRASAWSLPPGYPSMTFDSTVDTNDSSVRWALADLPGEGGVDVVVSRWDAAGIAGLGDTEWLVYDHDTSGFSSRAWAWTLPAGFPSMNFEQLVDAKDSSVNWTLLDLPGDGHVDLLVTRWDDAGISGLSTSQWLLYPGECTQ